MWCGRREIYAGNRRVCLTCGVAPLDLQPVDLRRRADSSLAGPTPASGRATRSAVSVRTDRRHRYSGRRINWIANRFRNACGRSGVHVVPGGRAEEKPRWNNRLRALFRRWGWQWLRSSRIASNSDRRRRGTTRRSRLSGPSHRLLALVPGGKGRLVSRGQAGGVAQADRVRLMVPRMFQVRSVVRGDPTRFVEVEASAPNQRVAVSGMRGAFLETLEAHRARPRKIRLARQVSRRDQFRGG